MTRGHVQADIENIAARKPDRASHGSIRLFVLIDALGWNTIKAHQLLRDWLPYRRALRTVLGFSSGAIPTILTGLPPSHTGHWNLLYYDPEGSPFRWLRHFGFLPERVLDHRVTRKLLKELGRRLLGLGPLFECGVNPRLLPWFNWVEKRNIYEPGGIDGAPSIFDLLAENGVPHFVYSYHRWTDQQILEQACRDLESVHSGFFFLYLSEMDKFLHSHCVDDAKLEEKLRWYEQGLAQVFDLARRRDSNAALTVFSDHGMTPVRNFCGLKQEVDALGFRMPEDYLAVYDSTMARFWFRSGSARTQITACLQNRPFGQILTDAELQRLGVFFPNRRYGEVVFLLRPGWLLAESDFNGQRWIPSGMHGYHPEDPYSDAAFLSDREPRFAVRTIADVFACMRETVIP